jgi:hypothetical protein
MAVVAVERETKKDCIKTEPVEDCIQLAGRVNCEQENGLDMIFLLLISYACRSDCCEVGMCHGSGLGHLLIDWTGWQTAWDLPSLTRRAG